MKRILVPCDFSTNATDAYRLALDIAAESKASIDLVHVIDIPMLHDTALMPVLNVEQRILGAMQEGAETEFKKLKSQYHKPWVKTFATIEYGNPYHMLMRY